MLKLRAISFPLLIGLLALIFFSPLPISVGVFTFCAVVMVGMAAYECARMMNTGLVPCFPKLSGILAGGFVLATLAQQLAFAVVDDRAALSRVLELSQLSWLLLVMICALLPWVATVFGGAETAKKGFTTIAVVWATIVPFGLVAVLFSPNPKFLFFVMMVTKAMDTGGYVFGMLSNKLLPGGNHKLCPSISPKKSWEGFAGGLLLAVVTAWALRAIFPGWDFSRYLGAFAWWKEIVLAVLLAVASICGDLTESALKRKCGVKDSGNLIPGMGGPLDVLDSFIYVGPVCLIFSKLILTFKL